MNNIYLKEKNCLPPLGALGIQDDLKVFQDYTQLPEWTHSLQL